MPTPLYMEPGTEATQDLSLFFNSGGTVSSATDQAHTGTRSLKCSTGPAVTAGVSSKIVLTDAGARISFWVLFDSTSFFANNSIVQLVNGNGQVVAQVAIDTTGKVLLTPAGGTSAQGTTTIVANRWYRIGLSYRVTSLTDWAFCAYLNGVLEAHRTSSMSSETLPYKDIHRFVLRMDGPAGGDLNGWFDDIYADDESNLSDTGSVVIVAKRPYADGVTNGFTTQIGTGGSGYGTGHAPQVNERPLSTSNGWSAVGAGTAITEQYSIEPINVGDVSIGAAPILGVMGWVYAKTSTGSQTASGIIDGTSSATVGLTTTPAAYLFASSTPTRYPGNVGADIGLTTSTDLQTVSLYECGVLVAIDPSWLRWYAYRRRQPAPFAPGRAR